MRVLTEMRRSWIFDNKSNRCYTMYSAGNKVLTGVVEIQHLRVAEQKLDE